MKFIAELVGLVLNFDFSILSHSNIKDSIRRKCIDSATHVKNNWQSSLNLGADDIFLET